MSALDPSGPSHRDASRRESNRFHSRSPSNRFNAFVIFIIGILEFYLFWFLYYTLELYIIACVCSLIGTALQIIGLVKLYIGARSSNGAKWLIGLLVGSTGLWAWLFLYYSLLTVQHILVL